ncbi:hypothetical protein BT69DRAFT_1358315 [Atractiella rhizophila]|nr:hypothetical protein BT69DRAFT_1358315 [Atractiella rhizophila]
MMKLAAFLAFTLSGVLSSPVNLQERAKIDITGNNCRTACGAIGGGPNGADCSALANEIAAMPGRIGVGASSSRIFTHGSCTIAFFNFNPDNTYLYNADYLAQVGRIVDDTCVNKGGFQSGKCIFGDDTAPNGQVFIQVSHS